MLNRINQLLGQPQRICLSIYFFAGCPPSTVQPTLSVALERNRSSMIEIGIPFQ